MILGGERTLVKPVFPNDSLTNQSIKVGDKVSVIDKAETYGQYQSYLIKRNISIDYWANKPTKRGENIYKKRPHEEIIYTVSYINYHDKFKDEIVCIISSEDGTYFIININALQLENG